MTMSVNTEIMLWVHVTVPLLLVITIYHSAVEGTCTAPSLNSNSYTLTEHKKQYATNDTYEISCIPGYTISGTSVLTCQITTTWSAAPPTCSPSEGTYPWWMLLVAVLVVVLLIACILPRLLVCLCRKTTKKKGSNDRGGMQRDNNQYDDDDDDDDDGRSESPPPDLRESRGNRMTNIEFMAKLHEDKDLSNLKRAKKNAVF